MIVVRCTQRLLKHSGIKPEVDLPAPTAILGEWYANVIGVPIGGHTVVLHTHNPTRLTVIVPGRSVRTTGASFKLRLLEFLRRLRIPEEAVARQKGQMDQVHYVRMADRSVLGTMNEFDKAICLRAAMAGSMERFDLSRMEDELSETRSCRCMAIQSGWCGGCSRGALKVPHDMSFKPNACGLACDVAPNQLLV